MSSINLRFVNNSNDEGSAQVVVFQKNMLAPDAETAIAWVVIENCAPGWSHPFVFPAQLTVAVSDSYGNRSPQQNAGPGEQFSVVSTTSGDVLQPSGQAASPQETAILNMLPSGAINANVYRNSTLLSTETNIQPGQKAAFQFSPTIYIGVVSQLEITPGEVMNSAIISQVNTEISLLGIAGADIVMTGGGPGTSSLPYTFTLENITYA